MEVSRFAVEKGTESVFCSGIRLSLGATGSGIEVDVHITPSKLLSDAALM